MDQMPSTASTGIPDVAIDEPLINATKGAANDFSYIHHLTQPLQRRNVPRMGIRVCNIAIRHRRSTRDGLTVANNDTLATKSLTLKNDSVVNASAGPVCEQPLSPKVRRRPSFATDKYRLSSRYQVTSKFYSDVCFVSAGLAVDSTLVNDRHPVTLNAELGSERVESNEPVQLSELSSSQIDASLSHGRKGHHKAPQSSSQTTKNREQLARSITVQQKLFPQLIDGALTDHGPKRLSQEPAIFPMAPVYAVLEHHYEEIDDTARDMCSCFNSTACDSFTPRSCCQPCVIENSSSEQKLSAHHSSKTKSPYYRQQATNRPDCINQHMTSQNPCNSPPADLGKRNEAIEMEWVVKKRPDGSRHITRRPKRRSDKVKTELEITCAGVVTSAVVKTEHQLHSTSTKSQRDSSKLSASLQNKPEMGITAKDLLSLSIHPPTLFDDVHSVSGIHDSNASAAALLFVPPACCNQMATALESSRLSFMSITTM